MINPLAMRAKAQNLPRVKVSESKVVEMLVQSGKSQDDAESTVKIMKILGSEVMIGDQMVSIGE
jgi:hypothetical protein